MGTTLTAVSALLLTALSPLTPTYAVPPNQPTNLSVQQPDGSTVVLAWERSADAVRYEVQVDDNASFSSPEVAASTVGNQFVPTLHLRPGAQYWRVQAVNNGAETSSWADGSFTKAGVEVPVLVSPAEGTPLAQPDDAPLLRWNASPGAQTYLVEVDDNDDFVGSTSYETRSTSFVVPDPLPSGDWFWRVVATKENPANLNLPFKSQPSSTRSFVIEPIAAPELTAPPSNPDHELQDVVLDWTPVPGAVSYEVEVATNTDFSNGSRVDRRAGILGTRYSPEITYDNNQYYWRVRAYDTAGQPTPWTEARYDFNRTYPHAPLAVYPAAAGAEDVPAPLYFQWTPVAHASEYEIQVGTQANFTDGTYNSCRTAGTTYTPGMFAINTNGQPSTFRENEDCEPQIGEINYWRVRPLDRPFTKTGSIPGVQGIYSETQAFRYMPNQIEDMTPTGGQVVDVPTLRWTPMLGADTYTVQIKKANGDVVVSATTSATSYTPDGQAPLAAGTYQWTIRASSVRGPSSLLYTNEFEISGDMPTSASPGLTPLTPTANTPGITGAPELTWAPVAGAAYYKVNIGNASDTNQVWFGSGFSNLFNAAVPYPAMTEISKRLMLSGTYDWQVEAFNASGTRIGSPGPEGRFTVQPIQAATGHALALGGQQLDANYGGPKNPCTQTTGGCTVPSTPVLKWDPDPRAAWYMVYVSEDASFTNLLEAGNAIPATNNTMYAPALDNDDHTYGDNQAGKAYFWYIRPCRAALDCGPDPVSTIDKAQGTFIKRSPAVTDPRSSSGAGGEITFSWDDYWVTNQAYTWPQTQEKSPQAAKQYRVEVSVNGSVVETALVDQTTYTSANRLYPEGTLSWRVQAVDSDDNGLTWTSPQTVTKSTPRIVPTSPNNSDVVPGTTPLRWPAQAFASSYDVQVARDEDTTFAPGSLILDRAVRTTAVTPLTPIPTSDAFYVWRVRKTDASGNKGPWSLPARFKVSASTMSPIAPTAGATVPPNGTTIQWSAVPSATRYNLTLRPASGPTVTVNTVASAWSPTAFLSLGGYSWTVVAYDANDKQVGSVSSSFSVDSQITALQPPAIESPGGTGVGNVLTSRPPQWSVAGVETTYQWVIDGQAPWTATGSTYTITPNDYGKTIEVVATGKKAGYLDGTSRSPGVSVTAGNAVNNLTRPSISGAARVGSYLSGNAGTWSGTNVSTRPQWLRDGSPIAEANSWVYQVAPADGGRQLTLRVTATASGYADGVATSEPLTIETLQATAPAGVSAAGGTGVGAVLSATPPVWNQSDVTTTYMWLRDGQQLWSSTGTTYTISSDDVGKSISVVATGRKPGFPDGTSTSNAVTATRGSAPEPISAPTLRGTGSVGQYVSVDPGTWNVSLPTFTYTWLRNGSAIPGATGTSYGLTADDAATQISVRITASAPGRADGVAVTAPLAVAQLTSTTSLSVLPYALTKSKRGKLTITVAAPGLPAPTGTLIIKDGKKTLKKLTLVAKNKGVVVFRLPRLKAGKHKLSVAYSGSAAVKASKGKLKLTVGR